MFDIFRRYTPLVEGLSLDEAFLDVTGSRALFGDGPGIATRIRQDIFHELRLTASAGVAPNKFVAKIASDVNKPDGLAVVPAAEVAGFLAPLPLERMWRVGPRAQARLREAGLKTIGDLARADAQTLELLLGSWGPVARDLARGVDDRPVTVGEPPKSLGSEETFEQDLTTIDQISKPLLRQSMRVADRLIDKGLWAGIVVLKIKYGDHRTCTRQTGVDPSVSDTDTIFEHAMMLLGRVPNLGSGVRLTGVAVSDLSNAPSTQLFLDESRRRREQLADATKALRDRFGRQSLTRASLLGEPTPVLDSPSRKAP